MPGLWLLDPCPQSAPQFSSSCQLCAPTPTLTPAPAPSCSGFLHMCGHVATCTLKIGTQLALHSLWLWYAMCPQEDRSREETTWAGQSRLSVTKRMIQEESAGSGEHVPLPHGLLIPWEDTVAEGLKWRPLH